MDYMSTLGNKISIHAPRMGSDNYFRIQKADLVISIHAPRMGSDDYKLVQCLGH